jgi:putative RNA 2'-phosphotransferase
MGEKHAEISKYLSYLLRHEPQSVGLKLDGEGWADIDDLISRVRANGKDLDISLVREVVADSEKKRFTLSDDGKRIRAAQGHSLESVAINFEVKSPPAVLYHGTASRFLASILANGLEAGERQYVHMSPDADSAAAVGKRHGKAIVLKIDAQRMHQLGYTFLISDNQVWMTAHVPKEFVAV